MPSRPPALPVAPEDEPEPFSAVLRRMAAADGDTLTLDEVASTFAGRGFGPVMLVFALINLLPWPPGGTSLVGLPLLVISAELAAGQREVWLPRWLEKASVSRRTFAGLLRRFDRPIDWVERVSRPRLAPRSAPLLSLPSRLPRARSPKTAATGAEPAPGRQDTARARPSRGSTRK